MPRITGRASTAMGVLPALLAAAAYAVTLHSSSFIGDDWALIAENPLLRARAIAALWTTGLWDAAFPGGSYYALYRPLASMSHLLDMALWGPAPGLMHLQSVALHALNAWLVFLILRRLMTSRAAWAAGLFFAAAPVHLEAVCGLLHRAELLAAAGALAAWLLLDSPDRRLPQARLAAGIAAYAGACLGKEHALLFPPALALSDWTFRGRRPWEPGRRGVHLGLLIAAAAYLAARAAALPDSFASPDYFGAAPVLVRVLTVSRFWGERYLWPSLSGLGLRYDFDRPGIPDSGPGDLAAWAWLLAWAAALLCSAKALPSRSRAAFWALWPFVFLLPTSHLLIPFGAVGAQRFLYLPSVAASAAAGALYERLGAYRWGRAACGALLLAWGIGTARQARLWTDDISYYDEVVRQAPSSAQARLGLGLALERRGDRAGAARAYELAAALNPALPAPLIALGDQLWDAGNRRDAQRLWREALRRDARSAAALERLGGRGHPGTIRLP